MNPYFTQLNIDVNILDPLKMDLTTRRTFGPQDKTYYSDINNIEYSNYLSGVFQNLLPRTISYCEFPWGGPHIDHDEIKCCINHYYITQDVETVYYEAKAGAKSWPGAGEKSSNFYNKEDITEVTKFFALPDSVWLLNVNKIHSLEFPMPFGPVRTFVKWSFDQTYEEVYQHLVANGIINESIF